MPEEVLFTFEQSLTRAEIGDYLRTVADRLESGDDLVLESGGDSVRMQPPGRPTFEVKAERETSRSGGPAEFSVEFELEWEEGDGENGDSDGSLTIS